MNFEDALNTKADEIERPKPLPIGWWIWRLTKNAEYRTVEGKNGDSDVVDFECETVGPCEDVDEDAVAEFGEPAGVKNRISFWFPKDPGRERQFQSSLFRMKQFLMEHCGLDAESPREAAAICQGAQFRGSVTWDPDPKDPENIYFNIGKTLPLEDDE